MKLMIAACFMVCSVTSARAVVNITWLSPNGTEITDVNGDPAPAGWLVQFIAIRAGGLMSNPTPWHPFPIGPDETFLSEQSLNAFDTPGALALDAVGFNTNYDDSLANGFAYARVYNVHASTSIGQHPTAYGVSQLAGGRDGGTLNVLDAIDARSANAIAPMVSVRILFIPEPSTYALMALGGLLIFTRLRKRC